MSINESNREKTLGRLSAISICIVLAFEIVFSIYVLTAVKSTASLVMLVMSIIFSVVIVGMIILMRIKAGTQEFISIAEQYEVSKDLMEKMRCSLIEYDVINRSVWVNEYFRESFGFINIAGPQNVIYEFMSEHREFDFEELKKIMSMSIIDHKIYSLECVLNNSGTNSLVWLMLRIIPEIDDNGEVNKLYIVVMDETGNHTAFEKVTSVMDRYPIGFGRVSRGDIVRLEYAGEGMRKMLGYSKEAFKEILGEDSNYLNLIHEDDHEKYLKCINGIVSDGSITTLYYRVRKSDGSYIRVLDAMEFGESSAGEMNIYLAMIEVSNYESANNVLLEDIEDIKAQLFTEKIKNSVEQLRPHYIYNALSSIREIVIDNPRHAYNLIYDFTVQLRSYVKAATNENAVDFSQELENVKAYLNIEKVRFGQMLRVEFDITETDFKILPLSIQTLVENAIRHGIYRRGTAGGTVKISTGCDDDSYWVTVEDDGIGFDVDETLRKAAGHEIDSTGLINLKYRLIMLQEAQLYIKSEPGVGTTATILIPKERENENNNS